MNLPSGRILAVHVGQARVMERPDWDRARSRTWTSAYVKEPVAGPIAANPLGLAGDEQHDRAVHGGPTMAVLAYANVHYPWWREELDLPEIGPGGFGENLVLEGLDEWNVCIGDVLEAGGVRLRVTQPRGPCANISRRWNRKDLLARVTAAHRTGWYLAVDRAGSLAAGERIAVVERPLPSWTIEKVSSARLDPAGHRAAVTFLASCPQLSEAWRDKFTKLVAADERAEVERRAVREIEIARDVQARLLPQRPPRLESLELAAACIQARAVGGDYYDFLTLGPRHVGFVLADVSGKGVHAALRMANLQAHLRSQTGAAPQDPLRALREVNRMLFDSTDAGEFATLFLGTYSDENRRFQYVNCGHDPPLVLRADGRVDRLAATATVLGAFEDWQCQLGRTQLAPGDLFAAYSDGITEARRGDEEFGEARLLEVLRAAKDEPAEAIVAQVLAAVQAFGARATLDDLTLVVARCR